MVAGRNQIHIPREQERQFAQWLRSPQRGYWAARGVGGIGKSVLCRRLIALAQDERLPLVALRDESLLSPDPQASNDAVQLLINLERYNTPEFDRIAAELTGLYQSMSLMLRDVSGIGEGYDKLATLAAADNATLGTVLGLAKDAVRLVSDLWGKERAEQRKRIAAEPEKHLLEALSKDFQSSGGLFLVDTWEKISASQISTRLRFYDGRLQSRQQLGDEPAQQMLGLQSYLGKLFDYWQPCNLLLFVAGRTVPSELGEFDPYLPEGVELPSFTPAEIRQYLEARPAIPLPPESVIAEMHGLTHGNPLLIFQLLNLIDRSCRRDPDWDWQESWPQLAAEFPDNDREGLLAYVFQRLATHFGDDRHYWRLAIPQQLDNAVADLLFPPETGLQPCGRERLRDYEELGFIERDPRGALSYQLHDLTREAMIRHAQQQGLWLSDDTAALHQQLAERLFTALDKSDQLGARRAKMALA